MKPRLLFFHSLRSGRSRRVDGYLAQVLQRGRNHDTFVIHRIAQEEHPELIERFRVVTFPTLLVVENRAICGRLEEPRGCKAIEEFLMPWLCTSSRRKDAATPEAKEVALR
jgi:hypothetical protein